jgi:hypothetical protein
MKITSINIFYFLCIVFFIYVIYLLFFSKIIEGRRNRFNFRKGFKDIGKEVKGIGSRFKSLGSNIGNKFKPFINTFKKKSK